MYCIDVATSWSPFKVLHAQAPTYITELLNQYSGYPLYWSLNLYIQEKFKPLCYDPFVSKTNYFEVNNASSELQKYPNFSFTSSTWLSTVGKIQRMYTWKSLFIHGKITSVLHIKILY